MLAIVLLRLGEGLGLRLRRGQRLLVVLRVERVVVLRVERVAKHPRRLRLDLRLRVRVEERPSLLGHRRLGRERVVRAVRGVLREQRRLHLRTRLRLLLLSHVLFLLLLLEELLLVHLLLLLLLLHLSGKGLRVSSEPWTLNSR